MRERGSLSSSGVLLAPLRTWWLNELTPNCHRGDKVSLCGPTSPTLYFTWLGHARSRLALSAVRSEAVLFRNSPGVDARGITSIPSALTSKQRLTRDASSVVMAGLFDDESSNQPITAASDRPPTIRNSLWSGLRRLGDPCRIMRASVAPALSSQFRDDRRKSRRSDDDPASLIDELRPEERSSRAA